MSAPVYDAFISYRHLTLDKAVAKKLHTLLETYKIPGSVQKTSGKKKMGKIFRDEEELPLATSLNDNIEEALRNSEWLIVICTPALLESRWCMREIDYFISLGRRDHILLVLADGTAELSFPKQLRFKEENGVLIESEPLAANIVGESVQDSLKKLKSEKLRILAPMLGVGYDDLRRRARQRKMKIAAGIAAAVLVAGAGTAFYLIRNAQKQEQLRREAEEQQRIAAEQASIAEEERRIAAEQQALAEQQSREAAEQARIAEEERLRAEEERLRAEEEKRKAEEKKLAAASSSIGELLEKAGAALDNEGHIAAARALSDALEISREHGDIRHDEIIALMRRTMYIEPYSVLSVFENQNIRLLYPTPSPDGTKAVGIVNSNSVALIDFSTNEVSYQVSVGNGMVLDPVFSPDGSRFAATCEDGACVCIWNTADGSLAFSYKTDSGRAYAIENAVFWKDSDTLLVQDWDHFYLISTDGGKKLLYTLGDQMDGYDPDFNLLTWLMGRPLNELITNVNPDVIGVQMLVSEDFSKILLSGLAGGTGTIILDGEGKRICLLDGMPGCFSEKYSLSPDGKTASCISYFGFFAGWDTDTGELIYINLPDESDRPGMSFSNMAYTADSSEVSFIINDKLYVADARTAEIRFRGEFDANNYVPELCYVDYAPYLLVTNQDFFIINTETAGLILHVQTDSAAPFNSAVSVGDLLFVTKNDGSSYLLSTPMLASVTPVIGLDVPMTKTYDPSDFSGINLFLQSEHKLSDGFLKSHEGLDVSSQMFTSREKDRVALAYADGVIELFDAAGDGKPSDMIAHLTSRITALGMAGNRLAAADAGNRFLIYDLEKKEVVKILNLLNNGYSYQSFRFDEEAQTLMALRTDGMYIDVYSLDDAELLFVLTSSDGFLDYGFSEDGSLAVAYIEGGGMTAELWKDEEALLTQLSRLLPKEP